MGLLQGKPQRECRVIGHGGGRNFAAVRMRNPLANTQSQSHSSNITIPKADNCKPI